MTRILFIARYRDRTMRCKVDCLARMPAVELFYVTPAQWQDELLAVTQTSSQELYPQRALPMHGKPTDPHPRSTIRLTSRCAVSDPRSSTPRRNQIV